MKITIVAFDLWGFNKIIADTLEKKGVTTTFIDSNKIHFKYKNFRQRLYNFFSKNFLGRNIKKNYRKRIILQTIQNLSEQDVVLIVNPDHFDCEIVNNLKTKTKKYIAYNYDSLERNPLPENFKTLFDKIYSFDISDVQKHSYLELLTNFIYIPQDFTTKPQNKMFMILSYSLERELLLSRIADILDKKNIHNYEFIVANPETTQVNKNILLTNDHISLDQVINKAKNAEILVDLIRPKQSGLSFRYFEAMALQKKIITNNESVKLYDFYNPNNILIIKDNLTDIDNDFLNNKYEPIPDDIYHKYTLDNWIKTVFKI